MNIRAKCSSNREDSEIRCQLEIGPIRCDTAVTGIHWTLVDSITDIPNSLRDMSHLITELSKFFLVISYFPLICLFESTVFLNRLIPGILTSLGNFWYVYMIGKICSRIAIFLTRNIYYFIRDFIRDMYSLSAPLHVTSPSHNSDITWASCRFNSPTIPLFVDKYESAHHKDTIKPLHYHTFELEIPHTKGQ